MIPITYQGSFDASVIAQLQANFAQVGFSTTGTVYYLDVVNGSNNNSGLYPSQALASLAAGYAKLTNGKNDVLVLIGNGATSATARLSANFAWSKSAAHMVGVTAPTYFSSRARIAPTSGATAFANLFTVSGSDCLFSNIEFFDGFNTGTTAQICLTLSSASRNVFYQCHLAGMGDAASAADAGSRSIKISGGGENVFKRCVVGLDTIARTNANASVEVASGTARNIFEDCYFPFLSGDGLQYALLATGNASFDRFVMFKGCQFINAVGSTSTAIAELFHCSTAAPGGIIVMDGTSNAYGVTALGGTGTKALTYVGGGTATNGVKGIVAS